MLEQILSAFIEEENSAEMVQAIKYVHASPILRDVLLQMFLRLKETQQEVVRGKLQEQEL